MAPKLPRTISKKRVSSRALSGRAPAGPVGAVTRVGWLAPVLALVVLLSCTVNPVTGRNEMILMSEEREQEIGDQVAKQVEAQMGLVDDPVLSSYVSAIGQALAARSPRPGIEYSFHIVDMPEPNAFALPGGYIYVSRGLVSLANSEAELAGVIAHEIGHVAGRHSAQRDTVAKVATIASVLGAVAAATVGDGSAIGATQYLGAGLIASYGREQERQADKIAQDLCADVGIDPAGMATFLRQLDNMTRLTTGASRAPGFFDSHPATPSRIAEAATRAQALDWEPRFAIAKTSEEFLHKVEGMVLGEPAFQGVFRGDHFLHADLGFALRFPPGWKRRNEHTRVIAVSPDRSGVVLLELQGEGEDPRAAALEFARENRTQLTEGTPLRLGGFRAFRARAVLRSARGGVHALITWVASSGQILRLSGGGAAGSFSRHEPILRSFVRGIRRLRPEDLEGIDELRLRLVRAREGESLAELSERTGNAWDLNETAVANAFFDRGPLPGGKLVKIAKRESYRPKPGSGSRPASDRSGGPPILGPAPPR